MRSERTRFHASALGRRTSIAFGACALVASFSAGARAEPMDAAANDTADKVMDPDRLYSNFVVAEKRLAAQIKKCGRNNCSKSVKARLYRDLGVVYVVGLRQLDKGKEFLGKAVKADPSIELDQRVATPELEQLFGEVGGGAKQRMADTLSNKAESPPKEREREREKEEPPEPVTDPERREAPEEASGESEPAGEDTSALEAGAELGTDTEEPEKKPEKPKEPRGKKKTFVSLSLQQDFIYYPGDTGVCLPDVDIYDCFDYRGSEYDYPIYDAEGAGNEVPSGMGRATTRLLLGYDRQVTGNALLGVRAGYAFGGGPTPASGSGFFAWHLEVRGALYFGSRPFDAKSVRPNLSLGVGLAEVTDRVAVDYWESESKFEDMAEPGKLDAWRRSGKFFMSPGFGLMIPVAKTSAITIDVRALFLFGKPATGMALAAGYALAL